MSFGSAVKRLRDAHGWKQQDLAARSGIPQATLSRIERGIDNNPTQRTLEKLAGAFEITVADLLAEAGVARPNLPLHDLPPFLVALGQRVGPLLTERDWQIVADVLTRLAEERAQARTEANGAHGYSVPEGESHQEEAPGKQTA